MVYRVLSGNASTVLLKIVAGLTDTAWCLTKTRCAVQSSTEVKSHRGRGLTVAVAVLREELLRDVTTIDEMTGSKTGIEIETETETETEIVIAVEIDTPLIEEIMTDEGEKLGSFGMSDLKVSNYVYT